MLLAKLKVVTAVLLAAAVVVPGACLLMGGATAARPAGPASVVKGSAAGPPAVSKGEKLKALMEKVRKAHGTSKQLAKHKTLRLKVEGKRLDIGEGDAFTRKETWRLPDQYRFEADAGHVDGVKSTLLGVVSKGKGWVRLTTGGVVTQEEELDKEDVASLGWGGAYTRALGVAPFLGDKGYALTYLGESKVNGKKAVGVLVKSKGLPDLKLYFDKASGLLLGAAHSVKAPGKEERWQLVFFSEYREKDGYKYPRRIVVHDLDGEELISEKVTAVEFPGELEDKVFAKP